jgi:hypothetical protein
VYTVGQALLQLHQQAEGQPAVPHVVSLNNETTASKPGFNKDSLSAELSAVLLCCVTAVAPALQKAAAELAAGGNSSTGRVGVAARRSMRGLLQLQLGLQDTLTAASGACSTSSSSVACVAQSIEQLTHTAEAELTILRTALTADTVQQLVDLGNGICVDLAAGQHWCCANPGCANLAELLERQLVAGKGTVCSACRSVRLCGPACNKAYWKAGHKRVCALYKQR